MVLEIHQIYPPKPVILTAWLPGVRLGMGNRGFVTPSIIPLFIYLIVDILILSRVAFDYLISHSLFVYLIINKL